MMTGVGERRKSLRFQTWESRWKLFQIVRWSRIWGVGS